MSIPKEVKINHGKLPTTPGVYLFKNKNGKVVYVGKATNLKSRVSSYWNTVKKHSAILRNRRMGRTIDEVLHEVRRIDWVITDSAIEALILEANLIRKFMPPYNVKVKDDKSFLYVVVTREQWPRVMLVRGSELKTGNGKFRIFGPYTSASSIRAALDLIRKWFPWSMCKPEQTRPCFDYHIGRCPGVCVGAITHKEYMKNIRNVILMLEGKKARVVKNVERKMKHAARGEKFEEAEKSRRKLFVLKHIRDVAVLKHDTEGVKTFRRIEGYDISNISGTSAVGSMVVFQNGEAAKSEYRKFRIKTVRGVNDVAMMREVLTRRLAHDGWPMPDLLVVDGGWGQVNAAQSVIKGLRCKIKVVGIAKGFKRKQDRPIFDKNNPALARIVATYKDLLLRVRDEAHRFAVSYHRRLRAGAATRM